MGTDITAWIEIKKDDLWQLDHIDIDRSYWLFNKLAGRRHDLVVSRGQKDTEPIALPRGLPDDVTPGLRLSYEGQLPEVNSASWLTFRELRDGLNDEAWLSLGLPRVDNEDEARLVFWFD